MMHQQPAGVMGPRAVEGSALMSSRQPKQSNPLSRLRGFQQNIHSLLTDPEFEPLFDVVIIAENKELRAHRCVLATCSEYFKQLFCTSNNTKRIDFQQRWVVVQQLIRCMYGADIEPGTDPEIILEVLTEARKLEVNCISLQDCISLIVDQLSIINCARVLTHEEVSHHRELSRQVCSYIVKRFSDIVRNPSSRQQLLHMPRNQLIYMIRELCRRCDTNKDTDIIVRFVVDWSQYDAVCDVLRDCKYWDWSIEPGSLSIFRDDESALQASSNAQQAFQWKIPNLCAALSEHSPMKYVVGTFFDWAVRIDSGAEDRLRIVYEAAVDRNPGQPACIKRFPAAQFAWQVIYRGQDVFRERPVFICFPEHVDLHWSTTLPINSTI